MGISVCGPLAHPLPPDAHRLAPANVEMRRSGLKEEKAERFVVDRESGLYVILLHVERGYLRRIAGYSDPNHAWGLKSRYPMCYVGRY